MGITPLSYRLCLSVARSPSEVVLTLPEPSFTAAGDTGQRHTHPCTPSYCLGTGTCRGRMAGPQLPRDGDYMGSGGCLGHTVWRNPAAMLLYGLGETPKGFIPFAMVSSQTTVAISSYSQRLKSCYQGLYWCSYFK